VPVEHVGFLIRVEDDVSRCDEVDLARVERDEEFASSLDGNFGADWKTEGRGERSCIVLAVFRFLMYLGPPGHKLGRPSAA
jgi:hypothetical protein